MNKPMHESRLARENRILRTAFIALGSAILGAAALGLTSNQAKKQTQRSTDKPLSITAEGGYIYVLFEDGAINRIEIESRERFNLQNQSFYHNNHRHNWNRFVESWR